MFSLSAIEVTLGKKQQHNNTSNQQMNLQNDAVSLHILATSYQVT